MTSQVFVLSPSHVIGGEINLKDQRLLDALNDRSLSVLQLSNASFARTSDPGQIVGSYQSAIILKDQIVAAYEPASSSVAGGKRLYSFVKKDPHGVKLLLPGIEVEGLIHTQGPLELADLHRLVSGGKEKFLPITQAVVTFSSEPRYLVNADAIMVSVQRIIYLAKADTSGTPERAKI